MFVDLVGSTELSLKLDPEELRDLSRAYQDATAREVGRYGGYVAKFMGDGVLVYFGYPQAHEDDAVRAIYAGLAVVRAVKRLGKRILAAHGGGPRAGPLFWWGWAPHFLSAPPPPRHRRPPRGCSLTAGGWAGLC